MGSLGHSCLIENDSALLLDFVSLGVGESGHKALDVGELEGGSGEEALDICNSGVIPG